jgi:hypothetical protein
VARLITAMGLKLIEAEPEAMARLRGANTPSERETLLAALEVDAQKPGAA